MKLFDINVGSNLHGTAQYGESDTDKLVVTLPTRKDILLGNAISYKCETNIFDNAKFSDRKDRITCTVAAYVKRIFKGHIQLCETMFALKDVNPGGLHAKKILHHLKNELHKHQDELRDVFMLKMANYLVNYERTFKSHSMPKKDMYHCLRIMHQFTQLHLYHTLVLPYNMKANAYLRSVKYWKNEAVSLMELGSDNDYDKFFEVVHAARARLIEKLDPDKLSEVCDTIIADIHDYIITSDKRMI